MWHRVFAGFILLINIYLFFKYRTNKYFKVGLVILLIQSGIGALNVFYKFPNLMSVAHLLLSLTYIWFFTASAFGEMNFADDLIIKRPDSLKAKDLITFSFLLLVFQVFLGAIINYTIPINECSSLNSVSLFCLEQGELVLWPLKVSSKIHVLHRLNGVFITLILVVLFFHLIKFDSKKIKIPGIILFTALAAQLFFSKAMIITNSTALQVAHLMGAIIMSSCLIILKKYLEAFEVKNFGAVQISLLSDLFELTKPRLGLLVIATIVCGVLMSAQMIDFFYLIFALFLAALIVASATTLNCYIEKDIDAKMERTKNRALPSGRIPANFALWQGIALIGLSIPLTIYFVNMATAILGLAAFLIYLFWYTPMKQKSPLALYIGAIPGAIPPVMGRTIVVGHMDSLAWILFAILFIWQIPHFMAISIYHKKDYENGGIIVYPHVWSKRILDIAIIVLTIILILCTLLPFYLGLLSQAYYYAALIIGIVFILISFGGLFFESKEKYELWARRYFFASIIYLPLLMAAMIFLS